MNLVHESVSSKNIMVTSDNITDRDKKVTEREMLLINSGATGQTAKLTREQKIFWVAEELFYLSGATLCDSADAEGC